MSRTKRFFYNSLTTAMYQIILMIVGFIIPLIMLKYYGSEINGLVSSINQFIVYFNIVEAGLATAAMYALYKPLADKNYKGVNELVSATKIFYIQAGYIFVSLTIGLAIFYPMIVSTEVINSLEIGLLVLILGVNGALEFFTLAKYRVLLTADQRTYVVSLASIVHIVVNTILIVIFAKLGTDIVTLRLVALFSIFLRSFILMFYVKKKYKWIDYATKPNFEPLNKRWDALYLQILGATQVGASIVILTVVTKDLLIVSIFTVYNIVNGGLRGILGIFKSGLSAAFGDVIAKEQTKTLQKSYKEFEFLYYVIITIIYFVAFVTIIPFIKLYTADITDVNYVLPVVGFLFILDGFLYSLKNPQGMLVLSAGLFKETKVQATIQGLILIILGVVLTYFFGLYGMLIASISSNLYRIIDLFLFVPKHITKIKSSYTFYRVIRMVVLMCILYIPFLFIDLEATNYLNWSINTILIICYSIIGVVLNSLLFDREELKGTIIRIKKIIF